MGIQERKSMSVTSKPRPKVKRRTPRKKVSQDEALAWLKKNHPTLPVEKNGDWVWITESVPASVRKSLAGYGFQRKKRSPGFTVLESGNHGTWSHSCNHPARYKFTKEGGKSKEKPVEPEKEETTEEELMAELTALLN